MAVVRRHLQSQPAGGSGSLVHGAAAAAGDAGRRQRAAPLRPAVPPGWDPARRAGPARAQGALAAVPAGTLRKRGRRTHVRGVPRQPAGLPGRPAQRRGAGPDDPGAVADPAVPPGAQEPARPDRRLLPVRLGRPGRGPARPGRPGRGPARRRVRPAPPGHPHDRGRTARGSAPPSGLPVDPGRRTARAARAGPGGRPQHGSAHRLDAATDAGASGRGAVAAARPARAGLGRGPGRDVGSHRRSPVPASRTGPAVACGPAAGLARTPGRRTPGQQPEQPHPAAGRAAPALARQPDHRGAGPQDQTWIEALDSIREIADADRRVHAVAFLARQVPGGLPACLLIGALTPAQPPWPPPRRSTWG